MHQHLTSLGENGKAYLGILVSLFILDECRKYLHDYNLYINFRNRFLEKPLMKQTTNEFPSPHNNKKKLIETRQQPLQFSHTYQLINYKLHGSSFAKTNSTSTLFKEITK